MLGLVKRQIRGELCEDATAILPPSGDRQSSGPAVPHEMSKLQNTSQMAFSGPSGGLMALQSSRLFQRPKIAAPIRSRQETLASSTRQTLRKVTTKAISSWRSGR
jgi:hypothetical protein